MSPSEIKKLQRELNLRGADLDVDGVYGPLTKAAHEKYGKTESKPPSKAPKWYVWAKQHKGRREQDAKFSAFISGFWKYVGLPGYKSIVGRPRAWCGVFVAASLISVGLAYQRDGAGARNWAKYGQAIDWRKNGIPRGAIIHINPSSCSSGSNNHVTFADGDCAPQDLHAGASVPGFGGNQGDQSKRSMYSVRSVCAVRWPVGEPLPAKITRSVDCAGKSSGNESTR